MAAFDDSADSELGDACNRLASWVEPLAEGQVIDPMSGLTERHLAMILRRLYEMRQYRSLPIYSTDEVGERHSPSPDPSQRKGPWG